MRGVRRVIAACEFLDPLPRKRLVGSSPAPGTGKLLEKRRTSGSTPIASEAARVLSRSYPVRNRRGPEREPANQFRLATRRPPLQSWTVSPSPSLVFVAELWRRGQRITGFSRDVAATFEDWLARGSMSHSAMSATPQGWVS